MRWVGHVARVGAGELHVGFGGRPDGNGPLGTFRHRWGDNIKMDLQEVGCVSTDWIALAQDKDGCPEL
jgi:hypothetical protein